MNIEEVLKTIGTALPKVANGSATKIQTENQEVKVTVYKVGSIIRTDIKEKGEQT